MLLQWNVKLHMKEEFRDELFSLKRHICLFILLQRNHIEEKKKDVENIESYTIFCVISENDHIRK